MWRCWLSWQQIPVIKITMWLKYFELENAGMKENGNDLLRKKHRRGGIIMAWEFVWKLNKIIPISSFHFSCIFN